MAQVQQLEAYQGTNQTLNLQARDNSNNPTNLTGKTLAWLVSMPPNEPTLDQAVISKSATIVSASGGTFTVALIPSDTSFLTPGNYIHQATTTDGSGNIAVVTSGRFRLRNLIATDQ